MRAGCGPFILAEHPAPTAWLRHPMRRLAPEVLPGNRLRVNARLRALLALRAPDVLRLRPRHLHRLAARLGRLVLRTRLAAPLADAALECVHEVDHLGALAPAALLGSGQLLGLAAL